MQSTLVGTLFHRLGWIYEEKYDGWRMLALKDGPRVRLISRQGVDDTERFRELAAASRRAEGSIARSVRLQRALHTSNLRGFDCLHLHGLVRPRAAVAPTTRHTRARGR